jgi:glutamate/tyrosine decarboxylase-like PLP-dependent enzyme
MGGLGLTFCASASSLQPNPVFHYVADSCTTVGKFFLPESLLLEEAGGFTKCGAEPLLREAFSLVPPYLRTEPDKGFGGMPWFSEFGFQQTRRFNALNLLWVIQQAGRTGLVAQVSRHNTLAQYMASLVEDVPTLELMAPVELSIVCFRYVPDSMRGEEVRLDALNKKIMEEVQARGKAFVNGTILDGRFVLRSCALHYALTGDDVVAIIEEVCHVAARCQP